MKSYESFMREVDEEVLQEGNPLKWGKNLLKGLGGALIPAGVAVGSGVVKGAKDLIGRALVPKEDKGSVVHGKEKQGPARSK